MQICEIINIGFQELLSSGYGTDAEIRSQTDTHDLQTGVLSYSVTDAWNKPPNMRFNIFAIDYASSNFWRS